MSGNSPRNFLGFRSAQNGSEPTRIKRWGVECMAWREPFKAGSRKGACRGGIDPRIDPTLRETGPDPPALSVRILFGQGCEPKPGGLLKENKPASQQAIPVKKNGARPMRIERRNTTSGQSPYAGIDFRLTTSEIRNPDGSVVFRLENVEVPAFWSQVASDVLAQKYFRKAGVAARLKKVEEETVPSWLWRSVPDTEALSTLPENERFVSELSAKQVFRRLAGCWTYWGWKGSYFSSEADARAFFDETCHMLAAQMAAPNSPQWFNTGLHWAYGIEGPSQGHYYVDPRTRQVTKSKSSYEHPQPHACFIQGIEDDLVNEGGIMDLWVREARLFKYGSGTGSNFSRLRGEGEKLSGGGRSSGLMSFLKIGDRAAGAIKSGGTTRRAAKMVTVDVD